MKIKNLLLFIFISFLGITGVLASEESQNDENLSSSDSSINNEKILEKIDTLNNMSMDKEYSFPRDIWNHYTYFLKIDIFYLVYLLYLFH